MEFYFFITVQSLAISKIEFKDFSQVQHLPMCKRQEQTNVDTLFKHSNRHRRSQLFKHLQGASSSSPDIRVESGENRIKPNHIPLETFRYDRSMIGKNNNYEEESLQTNKSGSDKSKRSISGSDTNQVEKQHVSNDSVVEDVLGNKLFILTYLSPKIDLDRRSDHNVTPSSQYDVKPNVLSSVPRSENDDISDITLHQAVKPVQNIQVNKDNNATSHVGITKQNKIHDYDNIIKPKKNFGLLSNRDPSSTVIQQSASTETTVGISKTLSEKKNDSSHSGGTSYHTRSITTKREPNNYSSTAPPVPIYQPSPCSCTITTSNNFSIYILGHAGSRPEKSRLKLQIDNSTKRPRFDVGDFWQEAGLSTMACDWTQNDRVSKTTLSVTDCDKPTRSPFMLMIGVEGKGDLQVECNGTQFGNGSGIPFSFVYPTTPGRDKQEKEKGKQDLQDQDWLARLESLDPFMLAAAAGAVLCTILAIMVIILCHRTHKLRSKVYLDINQSNQGQFLPINTFRNTYSHPEEQHYAEINASADGPQTSRSRSSSKTRLGTLSLTSGRPVSQQTAGNHSPVMGVKRHVSRTYSMDSRQNVTLPVVSSPINALRPNSNDHIYSYFNQATSIGQQSGFPEYEELPKFQGRRSTPPPKPFLDRKSLMISRSRSTPGNSGAIRLDVSTEEGTLNLKADVPLNKPHFYASDSCEQSAQSHSREDEDNGKYNHHKAGIRIITAAPGKNRSNSLPAHLTPIMMCQYKENTGHDICDHSTVYNIDDGKDNAIDSDKYDDDNTRRVSKSYNGENVNDHHNGQDESYIFTGCNNLEELSTYVDIDSVSKLQKGAYNIQIIPIKKRGGGNANIDKENATNMPCPVNRRKELCNDFGDINSGYDLVRDNTISSRDTVVAVSDDDDDDDREMFDNVLYGSCLGNITIKDSIENSGLESGVIISNTTTKPSQDDDCLYSKCVVYSKDRDRNSLCEGGDDSINRKMFDNVLYKSSADKKANEITFPGDIVNKAEEIGERKVWCIDGKNGDDDDATEMFDNVLYGSCPVNNENQVKIAGDSGQNETVTYSIIYESC